MQVTYFSDVLCIWAFVSEIRLDEVRKEFGERIDLDYRFIPVFGSTHELIVRGWEARGGKEGYARHAREVAEPFDHIDLHPSVWRETFPTSSTGCHLTLKAIQLLSHGGPDPRRPEWNGRSLFEEAALQFRLAFFRDGIDISARANQEAVLEGLGADLAPIRARIDSGEAMAALNADERERDGQRIKGSPTFVMNYGRQILYGNVGYRLIRANIEELLNASGDRASWC